VSLQNLLKIGQIKEHPTDSEEVERLLSAADRNLRDANYTGDDVDDSTAENCIAEAKRRLIGEVMAWRAANRPKLVPKSKS
jgi:hypothetical protein